MVKITSTFTKSPLLLAHWLHGWREPFWEALVLCPCQGVSSLELCDTTFVFTQHHSCKHLSSFFQMSAWKTQPCLQAWSSLLNSAARSWGWVSPMACPCLKPQLKCGQQLQQGEQIPQTASWGRSKCGAVHRAVVAKQTQWLKITPGTYQMKLRAYPFKFNWRSHLRSQSHGL